LVAVQGLALEQFVATAAELLQHSAAQTMLTPGIWAAYQDGVDSLSRHASTVAKGVLPTGPNQCQAQLLRVSAAEYLANPALQAEVFGAAALIVQCRDEAERLQLAEALEGQLTATLQLDDGDIALARSLLPVLERKAGRILVNGWPTGVECVMPWCMAGRSRPRRMCVPPRWARQPSSASCARCAIRTCRMPCCRQPCSMAIRWLCAGW
jgi:NADP-dependent aldehyde dehydrogenase